MEVTSPKEGINVYVHIQEQEAHAVMWCAQITFIGNVCLLFLRVPCENIKRVFLQDANVCCVDSPKYRINFITLNMSKRLCFDSSKASFWQWYMLEAVTYPCHVCIHMKHISFNQILTKNLFGTCAAYTVHTILQIIPVISFIWTRLPRRWWEICINAEMKTTNGFLLK